VLLAILLFGLLILFSPFKLDYSFEAMARIFPGEEWLLVKGRNEGYSSHLKNHRSDIVSQMKDYRFERGDIAEVHLKKGKNPSGFINSGDTIAYIHSYFIENEIMRLENLKSVEYAVLGMESTGEKQTIIDQAYQKYLFAQKQLELEKKVYERYRILFNDSIIATSEFEMYESAYNLAVINTEIAHNEYLAIKTGKKSEEINAILQKIASYDHEISRLRQQKDQYFIVSPLSGNISFNNEEDVILKVTDTGCFVLVIPILISNYKYLDKLSGIRFSVPGSDISIGADYLGIEGTVNLVANQQAVLAKALVRRPVPGIREGMLVQCRVVCDRITLFEYLKRGVRINR